MFDELDAYQKFNRVLSEINEEFFDIQREVQKYFEEEKILRNYDDFAQVMEKHPDMVPVPLRSYFRRVLIIFSNLVKTVILLEQEIGKI